MKNPETNSSPISIPEDVHSKKLSLWMVCLMFIILALISAGVAYLKEHSKTATLSHQNSQLSAQETILDNEVKQQNNTNHDIVSTSTVYKDPPGKIELANGTITMTLPKSWMRMPAGECTGGTIDSTIVCQDIASVAPSNMINTDGTTKWSANVEVFDYNNSDGDAKNWYYTKYEDMPAGSDLSAVNPISSLINGYSAYSEQIEAFYTGTNDPEYVDAYYAVVHGQYGVVITTQIEAGSINGPNAFDYRTTLQPLINQMVQSIKFQD